MIRRLAAIPPREIPRRALGVLRRESGFAVRRALDRVRSSYAPGSEGGPLTRIFPAPPVDALRTIAAELAVACERDLAHEFDLLGSGPVRVAHGLAAKGTAGHRYDSAPRPGERINAANRAESRRIRGLIDADYAPIDWHLDFRSGFRWDEAAWWRDVPIGHLPGVDVKVPWELSRMQHLPRLACAHALAAAGAPGFAAPDRYAREIRNQILDWIAANPPRFGVNWRMPMDVALRVVSWLAAHDLLTARGVRFDDDFLRVFGRSVREHGAHVVRHLEWNREVRGNHYLANVAGLLFCAAFLPRDRETDAWLAWSAQELGAETALQFTPDGASFEASTAYHVLSMEMVAWSTALLRALPAEKAAALAAARPRDWPRHPPLGPNPSLPASHDARIVRMADFAASLTKPSGRMAQIGDNDSGRFLPIRPPRPELNPAEPISVAAALTGAPDPVQPASLLVSAMIASHPLASVAAPGSRKITPQRAGSAPLSPGSSGGGGERAASSDTTFSGNASSESTAEILIPGGSIRDGAEILAFPDFGVYVYRSKRLWMAIRCGGQGQIALAGHAHEDQLAIELCIDGIDVIADPGTYLYTALPEARLRYRSATAHAVPHTNPPLRVARPGATLFELHDRAIARCVRWDDAGFDGELEADGVRIHREIRVNDGAVRITDRAWGGPRILPPLPAPTLDPSPAYGVTEPRVERLVGLGDGRWEWRGG